MLHDKMWHSIVVNSQQFCDWKAFVYNYPHQSNKKKWIWISHQPVAPSVFLGCCHSKEKNSGWLVLLQLVRWCRVWQDDNSVFNARRWQRPVPALGGPLDPHQRNLSCFHFTLSASNSKLLKEELVAERGGPYHQRVQQMSVRTAAFNW